MEIADGSLRSLPVSGSHGLALWASLLCLLKRILRAADLLSAVEDGRISSLNVAWTEATTV